MSDKDFVNLKLPIRDIRVTKRSNLIRFRDEIRIDIRWGKNIWKVLPIHDRMTKKTIAKAFRSLADALEAK